MKIEKNLFGIIILCLFIGWTIGFYLGIPKHITFDTTDTLIDFTDNTLIKLDNITKNIPRNSYINTTIYADYGYGNYKLLLNELKKCNNNKEMTMGIIEQCKDKSWCDCDDKQQRNPIITNILMENNNKKRFCISFKELGDFNCDFTEADIRLFITNMPIETELEIYRFLDKK